jgi:hypothetical protein
VINEVKQMKGCHVISATIKQICDGIVITPPLSLVARLDEEVAHLHRGRYGQNVSNDKFGCHGWGVET